jgi:hypothetical protein
LLRLGRYISLPDIEAQLAPNNYMYTHSLTYAYDNYTNEGLVAALAVTPHVILQFGISVGTETTVTNVGNLITNPNPNPLFPSVQFPKDPGARLPTFTACARFDWNDGKDNFYLCMNGINSGAWGYNNLQWYRFTYYHEWNDHWHIAMEFYNEHENGVPNINNPNVAFTTPFSHFNQPGMAHCSNPAVLRCNAFVIGAVTYRNYSPDALNNFSFRPEIYCDPQGSARALRLHSTSSRLAGSTGSRLRSRCVRKSGTTNRMVRTPSTSAPRTTLLSPPAISSGISNAELADLWRGSAGSRHWHDDGKLAER